MNSQIQDQIALSDLNFRVEMYTIAKRLEINVVLGTFLMFWVWSVATRIFWRVGALESVNCILKFTSNYL